MVQLLPYKYNSLSRNAVCHCFSLVYVLMLDSAMVGDKRSTRFRPEIHNVLLLPGKSSSLSGVFNSITRLGLLRCFTNIGITRHVGIWESEINSVHCRVIANEGRKVWLWKHSGS